MRKMSNFLKPESLGGLIRATFIYVKTKLAYSVALSAKKGFAGQTQRYWLETRFVNFLTGKMTYLYRSEGKEMIPTIPEHKQILLIRKLACPYARTKWGHERIYVGDVVLVRSPLDLNRCLVRRLAALGGQEMVSTKVEDETFDIKRGQCWVLADNQNLKVEEANDSRTWGPISINNIMGRVIYRFQNIHNQERVQNSKNSLTGDLAILLFELDLDEMLKSSKACEPPRKEF